MTAAALAILQLISASSWSRAWHGGAQVGEGVHNLQLRVVNGDDWGGLSTLRQDVGLPEADC